MQRIPEPERADDVERETGHAVRRFRPMMLEPSGLAPKGRTLSARLARGVDFCFRHALAVLIAAAVVSLAGGIYAARRFAIDTNISNLISSELPWRQRELAYEAAFPQTNQSILAVVDAPTPELAGAAERAFTQELAKDSDAFRSVTALGEFFARHSLLYMSAADLKATTDPIKGAAPLIGTLNGDPSLRGLTQALMLVLTGVQAERLSLEQMSGTFDAFSAAIEDALAGRPAYFSWKVQLNGKPAGADDLRRLVEIWARLDFANLEPGRQATDAVRAAAQRANLADDAARLRLTGPVPIADTEFGSLREGATLNGIISAALVLLILWLALGSWRLVLAVAVTLGAGLAVAAGLGIALVGALNPISIAFAVLFVGLGADFAIQFSMRYRERRYEMGDLHAAVVSGAQWIGVPLMLAALSAAAGFFSFIPTSYRGLAELGLISGFGMLIAYLACMTLLPALMRLVRPPSEPHWLGFPALAGADRFLARHRIAVVVATAGIVVAGLPLLAALRFDFNPLHLRDPNEEAIATYLELARSPTFAANPAEVMSASAEAATAVADKLAALPEVAQTRTIDSFVPDDQDEKLKLIAAAATALDSALDPGARRPAPSDAENVAALKTAAERLEKAAEGRAGPAKRLAGDMMQLANASADVREAAQTAFAQPLGWDLDELRAALHPERITRTSLPADFQREWISPDGHYRTQAVPKGDQDDNATLQRFADAVLAAEPNATGSAISIALWAQTMITAFIEAGLLALAVIALILMVALRRVRDMLLTLIPLLVAAVITLEISALIGFPLNYANIMALPVLLGIGVAFKIYYITAWRAGESKFLQSVLTRAVFFSALMTATAFGSLWISSNPGISSMGRMLVLSLACTLASAALFQPALMGPPRRRVET